jgi:hypothetical protein
MDELRELRRRLERAEARQESAAYQGPEWDAATSAVVELRSSCLERVRLLVVKRQAVIAALS